jgi:hypothetical protein
MKKFMMLFTAVLLGASLSLAQAGTADAPKKDDGGKKATAAKKPATSGKKATAGEGKQTAAAAPKKTAGSHKKSTAGAKKASTGKKGAGKKSAEPDHKGGTTPPPK